MTAITKTRSLIAATLDSEGFNVVDVAIILNLYTKSGRPWKERARQLIARGNRIVRERKNKCTCPAAVDITYIGHLPGCPEGGR